jgi:Flp pilus assembly protein TadB
MLKVSSHVQHMVLVAGIVVVAVWMGAAGSTALLFAAVTCAAMLGALLWFVVTATRDDERHRAEPSDLPEARSEVSR